MVVERDAAPAAARGPVLLVMCVGYFLVLLDVTVVNVALPAIGTRLGAGVAGLQWVVDGYALALAALLLTGGTLGDLRGHKRVVLGGLAVFGVASLACGLAPGTAALVAARVGQGIGAALLLPGTLAVIAAAYPGAGEQARAIGVWAGVGSVALPAGPLLGGALVAAVGWRWVFLLNVPITLVAGLVVVRRVHESREPTVRRLDWAGVSLAAAFLTSITVAIIVRSPWALVLAAVTLVGFLVVERSVADPMLPPALFRRPAFTAANATAGVMNLATLGMLFLLTLYLQTLRHDSPVAAGLAVLPLFMPLAVLAPLTGRVAARVGPRVPMAVGLVVTAIGFGLLYRLREGSDYPTLLPALLCWGIGLAVLTPAVVAAAVAAVEPSRVGLASGVNNTMRQAGGVVGIAVAGALAGSPSESAQFMAGMRTAALGAAVLFVATAVVALAARPSAAGAGPPLGAGRRRG